MFTIKGCSLIRGVHYERFHCIAYYNICVGVGQTGNRETTEDRRRVPGKTGTGSAGRGVRITFLHIIILFFNNNHNNNNSNCADSR